MRQKTNEKARLVAIAIVSIIVIVTGTLFSAKSFMHHNIAGGILGTVIAIVILAFAVSVFLRGSREMKAGFPLHDERSRRVLDRASSRAFYVSLYLLLAVGFLSEHIPFRDVSQATGLSIGGMTILFAGFWVYYRNKEV